MQPLRSNPITGPSSLLRAAPPLCLASVLRLLRDRRLSRSLSIETTGSHVPYQSLYPVHATSMPVAARAINRFPPSLSRSVASLRFRRRLMLSTPQRWFACTRLLSTHLTHFLRLFLDAHYKGSLPMQLKVVWNLRLHADSEGPALIFDTALRRKLTPPHIRDTLTTCI